MRATSKVHVEYEVLRHLLTRIDLSELEDKMVNDFKNDKNYETLAKRFADGSDSIASTLINMVNSRLHRLPKKHPAYKEKEE